MSIQDLNNIKRRQFLQVKVGDVLVGGDAPISVQSMTNTNTWDVDANGKQTSSLEKAGVDIVRGDVPTMEEADGVWEK